LLIFLFLVVPFLIAPLSILFVVLRRVEKRDFWGWYFTYSLVGMGGAIFLMGLVGVCFPLLIPVAARFERLVSGALKALGLPLAANSLIEVNMFLAALVIWFCGFFGTIWMMGQAQHFRRGKDVAELAERSREVD